ncbi:hypothetical protein GP486_002078 [Trichoglossum hirsutum]|uniref:Uncharacterized protein n=1 Tax=Trichoglossum hirsutum TaxID=265104 RepID=A0A9P8RS16_9PEZI|nr:hypothetical protein GP486_002078 [Trichoglossum hirsutum]
MGLHDSVTFDRFTAFPCGNLSPSPDDTEKLDSRHLRTGLRRSSPTCKLDSVTMDCPTPGQRENSEYVLEGCPPIAPGYKDMKANFFIVSMLLNGNPACAKHDLTFATHLSCASTALLTRAMQGISGVDEIWTTGRDTLLPTQPWVLWAFVMQELCKTVISLLSRKPSEVLLLSVHPLKPVDHTLLEWEHHQSYTRWMSPQPPNSPVDATPLLECYATAMKAAIGLLMIYVARLFGPISATSLDFNILGYKDPDLPADAPRNLYFGDTGVTVRNSPGIFIYEAGINVIETCKVLEVDRYDTIADELKQTLVEAIFSNMSHIYPEKMLADLTAIEQRIVPPVEKPHTLRATASEFHPCRSGSPDGRTVMSQGSLPDTLQPSRLSRPSTQPRNVYQISQSAGIPLGRQASPLATSLLPTQHAKIPAGPKGLQDYADLARSMRTITEPGPRAPSTATAGVNPPISATARSGFQSPHAAGAHLIPSTPPTLPPQFHIRQALNTRIPSSIVDPRLHISRAAAIHSDEQLFHECRQTARRLLGLPVSPDPPSPFGLWSPQASWYRPPVLLDTRPTDVSQFILTPNLPTLQLLAFPGHNIGSQGYIGTQNLSDREVQQSLQTSFSRLNIRPPTVPASSPDARPPTMTAFQDPQPNPQPSPALTVQHPEPPCPIENRSSALISDTEPLQRWPVKSPRWSRFSNLDTRAYSRPLARHIDDYKERFWGSDNP